MTDAFRLSTAADGVATLVFDTPNKSANVFTRQALEELERLTADLARRSDLRALLLVSAKPRIFIAGADVEAIAGVTDPAEAEAASRRVQAMFASWERLPFPTIAAVRGTCVGGGTELALASTYIVISDRADVRIGLPETRLGIVPGWGGCVRLPRRVGLLNALGIILAGNTIAPKPAFKMGLADALLPDAAFDRLAHAFAVAAPPRNPARTRGGPLSPRAAVLERNPLGRAIVLAQARRKTLATTKGHYPAPLRALDIVATGLGRGPEAGYEAEARAIGELAVSPIAKNLIHVFQLMEGAKKEAPLPGGEARAVEFAAVLGAGVMGGGIAHLVADQADVPVRLRDIAPGPLASGIGHAAALFRKQLERRRLTAPALRRKMALIEPTLEMDGLRHTDLVIEAIVEKLDVKQKTFAALETAAPDAILASNTSSLPIDEIARQTRHPERVVGMHFFNPVHKMPLVEVIAGRRTSPAAINTVAAFARRLGKTPVRVKDGPGFLVNRLLAFYMGEALSLFAAGAPAAEIDAAMVAWGMPMGPIALVDEVGIDVAEKVSHILGAAFGDRLPALGGQDKLVAAGRLGAKNSKGFYRYEGKRRTDPDPEAAAILGVTPKPGAFEASQMVDRMILPMVNEAARCLDERVVESAGHLDLAMILGTGFPPFRGGLCRWADAEGVYGVVNRLKQLAATVGHRFAPAPQLLQVAAADGFYAAYAPREASISHRH